MQYSNYEDSYDPNDVPEDQAAPLTAYQPQLPTYSSVNNDLSAYGDNNKDRDVKPSGGVRNGGNTARFTVAPAPTGRPAAAAAATVASTSADAVNPPQVWRFFLHFGRQTHQANLTYKYKKNSFNIFSSSFYSVFIIFILGAAKEEPEITTYSPPIDFKLGTTASQGTVGFDHGLWLGLAIW